MRYADILTERTFLAWLRTSLAFASIGVAITQLFRLNTTLEQREGRSPVDDKNVRLRQVGKPLGATFLVISIVVLLVGGRRYFESQVRRFQRNTPSASISGREMINVVSKYWIIRGKFPASRGSIFLVTFIAAALIVASLAVILIVNPTVYEKR